MSEALRENPDLGKVLVAAVLDHARGRVEMVQLTVVSENKSGFTKRWALSSMAIEKRAHKHRGRYYDEVLMVKFLDEGLS